MKTMNTNTRKSARNDAAFTGLEAAIVLIAFVVVAAVFSYVMLGAGFFTSQKSKEVVHTGTEQATSSVALAGDIIGYGTPGNPGSVDAIEIPLTLTAGNNPIDLDTLVISYKTDTDYYGAIWGDNPRNQAAVYGTWGAGSNYCIIKGNTDHMIDQYEQILIRIDLTASLAAGDITALPGRNSQVTLEVKPSSGAVLPITFFTPDRIKTVMTLH